MSSADTIFALSSAPGECAIAIVRISGTAAETLAESAFVRSRPMEAKRATLVRYHDLEGKLVDELIAIRFAAENSFTGEDTLELYPHGNPLIVQSILEDLGKRSLRPAEPGEFTRRAFLNGRIDLSQAEAISELIQARSERALAAAHRMLAGGLGRSMGQLTERLLAVIAHLEAYIDFPEEDLPPEDTGGPLAELRQIGREVGNLIASEHYGNILRGGVKALILGAPNVGKSSLINALTGRRRAIVSEQAGTTRDIVSDALMIDGHRIEIMDTAGIREDLEAIEAIGVDYAMEEAKIADFFILVLDGEQTLPYFPAEVRERMSKHNALVIRNKSDLPQTPAAEIPNWAERFPRVAISALTGDGIKSMRTAWAEMLKRLFAQGDYDGVTVNARHAAHLRCAKEHLEAALGKLIVAEAGELAAADLREALEQFAGVVGRVDNERMLDKLFAQFCIGK